MVYTYYNLTNLTAGGNETTILTFATEINNQMNAVPMLLILAVIYIVLFISLVRRGFDTFKVFAGVSFAVMLLTFILYPTGLISGKTLVTTAIICPFSLFILFVFGGKTE